MRLPGQEHTSRPWRIHELTRDFRVEDVWALPAAGRREDFPRLVAQLAAADPTRGSSRASRALWVIRVKIGGMLGWDGPDAGPGRAAASWAGGSGVPAPQRVVASLLTQAARREAQGEPLANPTSPVPGD